MQPSRIKLRPYQVRLVTDICRAAGDVLVEQPTGSGKTLAVVTLVAMHLGGRFTHAVIAAPQEQIEHGFVHRPYQVVAFPDCPGGVVNAIGVPEELIWGARQSGLGSVRRLLAYLRQPAPEHALACTHAALNRLTDDALSADLSGKVLFIDEAHHASADGLPQIVSTWRERGGRLFFFTATPYRGDGRPVALEGMRLFRRSLAEHMAEGFAPRHFESEIVALGRPGDAITGGQLTGEVAPPPSYFDGLVMAIRRKWLEDGKPKAIVRVPPMQGGSEGLVNRLLHVLAAEGARTLDASGTAVEDKRRFLNALKAEKTRTCATSAYDIMVGIQRVLEGTDWPVCSAVYCVGMPRSLNTVVQLLGRAMRLKGADHPAAHRDRARLVFFVPCGGGAALADLSNDHGRHALLTCCFLADHEVGQEWIVLREIRRGIQEALGSPEHNPAAAQAENEAAEPLDPEVRADVELLLADAREQIIGQGREPTLGDLVQQAMQVRKDLPESAFRQVGVEVLAGQGDIEGAKACEAVRREVARRLRIQPEIKQAMAEAFAAVLDAFRDTTLQKSAVLESVSRQVHGVTGGQMQEFAKRLRDAAPPPLTEEQIVAWADEYHKRSNRWPTRTSGPVQDTNETWEALDGALKQGHRMLPGNGSLARLLFKHRGVRNIRDLPKLSIERILVWADAHHEQTGYWPTHKSGPIADAPGEKWSHVNEALTSGSRGLPGGSSLAQLLAETRGVRNIQALPPFAEDLVLRWADAYHERTGTWPKHDSGSIAEAPEETWGAVDKAMGKARRGFNARTSLAQFLAEHRGVRNLRTVPPLSKDQILGWADAHYDRTGRRPTAKSGPIADALDETWANVDQALSKGIRGLPPGSSLARLLATHGRARNQKDLPSLSVDQILAWADAHHERTGHWPKSKSGPILDAPDEIWANVNQALVKGLRGRVPGSSLARLLAEYRGVRNIKDLRPLSVEQILVWANAHHARMGQWPTTKGGRVADAPGETWANINQALVKGLRGFAGGSSLRKLLTEYRSTQNGKGYRGSLEDAECPG
jgi:hypothetical protein